MVWCLRRLQTDGFAVPELNSNRGRTRASNKGGGECHLIRLEDDVQSSKMWSEPKRVAYLAGPSDYDSSTTSVALQMPCSAQSGESDTLAESECKVLALLLALPSTSPVDANRSIGPASLVVDTTGVSSVEQVFGSTHA